MVNKVRIIALLFIGFSMHCIAAENQIKISSSTGSALMFSQWNAHHGGWGDIEYKGVTGAFRVYGFSNKSGFSGLGTSVSVDPDMVSSNKKFMLVERTVAGEVTDENGKDVESDQNFCDVVSLDTGCVKDTGDIAQCDGVWDGAEWKVSSGGSLDFSRIGMPPQKLISEISGLSSGQSRTNSLKDLMFMGVDSYMACYPPKDNISQYNDLGFYFAKGGEHFLAMQIYSRLLDLAPDRVPLKLNIADSLWALGQKNQAGLYYSAYRNAMLKKGSIDKVPKRVDERVQ
jgi:hypothetical protein